MTDHRKLLENAAKAAWIELGWNRNDSPPKPFRLDTVHWWNPITDDGDEARLEAALKMSPVWEDAYVYIQGYPDIIELYADHNGDKQAARRMAGTRAAEAIGEKMP